MKFVFRADASDTIGSGHVMRCLSFAQGLSCNYEHSIHFICRQLPGAFDRQIQSSGFDLTWIPAEIDNNEEDLLVVKRLLEDIRPDWLIVDSYRLNADWERGIRDQGIKVLAIDDYGSRQHDCDVLLDQNLGAVSESYTAFAPENCSILAGPEYALLRPEFRSLRCRSLKARNTQKQISKILLTLGYAAPINTINIILEGISQSDLAFADVSIVHEHAYDVVLEWQGKTNLTLRAYRYVDNIGSMMADCDLVVSNAGSTSWERCCLGLPAIMITMSDNQVPVANALEQYGAGISLGSFKDVCSEDITNAIYEIALPSASDEMSANAASICDGLGAQRLSLELMPEHAADKTVVTLRPAKHDDAILLYEWQRLPETRRYARTVKPPSFEEHVSWFAKRIAMQCGVFTIIEHNRQPVGMLRLDLTDDDDEKYEVSIFIIPEKMKIGIASAALRILRRLLPEVQIWAEILPDNQPSITLFERSGYQRAHDNWYRSFPVQSHTV